MLQLHLSRSFSLQLSLRQMFFQAHLRQSIGMYFTEHKECSFMVTEDVHKFLLVHKSESENREYIKCFLSNVKFIF